MLEGELQDSTEKVYGALGGGFIRIFEKFQGVSTCISTCFSGFQWGSREFKRSFWGFHGILEMLQDVSGNFKELHRA